MKKKFHSFHLVDLSPWPFAAAAGVLSLALGFVGYVNRIAFGLPSLCWGLAFLAFVSVLWFRDVSREGGYLLSHSQPVRSLLMSGFVFFVASEAMLFLSFFWSLFHVRLEGGDVLLTADWPLPGVTPVGPGGIPFLNTLILVTSGGLATAGHWAALGSAGYPEEHYPREEDQELYEPVRYHIRRSPERRRVVAYLVGLWRRAWLHVLPRVGFLAAGLFGPELLPAGNRLLRRKLGFPVRSKFFNSTRAQLDSVPLLLWAVGFGTTFILLQLLEYVSAPFSISDGSYGSAFFLLTGFHGAHVLAGGIFLLVSTWRLWSGQFCVQSESVGLECAVWYWHFVDLIWLYLFAILYLG